MTPSPESAALEVLAAAGARAAALVAGDADELRRLLHPDLRWTTHRGEMLDRDRYIEATRPEDSER